MTPNPFIRRLCAECDTVIWAEPDETDARCYVHDRMHQNREARTA